MWPWYLICLLGVAVIARGLWVRLSVSRAERGLRGEFVSFLALVMSCVTSDEDHDRPDPAKCAFLLTSAAGGIRFLKEGKANAVSRFPEKRFRSRPYQLTEDEQKGLLEYCVHVHGVWERLLLLECTQRNRSALGAC